MRIIRRLCARIAGMFASSRHDADVREEMAAHLEIETAEYVRRGMSPDEARRQALLIAGGVEQAVEAVRDQRGLPWLESIGADIRYAARTLSRSPGFTIVVIVTLALGIGANTAIFSVVRGVLLRPLPHRDGDRLLYLQQSTSLADGGNIRFSVPEVRDLRADVPALGGGIAEYSPWSVVLQTATEATRLRAGIVTGNYFDVMGLSAVVGRLTRPSDDGPSAAPVVVLTHEFWQSRFGGDAGVVGTKLAINGTQATVIGVLQPAPFFPASIDILTNMVISPHHIGATMQQNRQHRMTEVVARLAPGATLAQARVQVATEYARLRQQYPEAYPAEAGYQVAVIPFKQALGARAQLTLAVLLATAVFVLIIAAANVANLTLMRSVRREHELAVRASLGAGVGRLRRLLLVENLMISGLGASLGAVLALAGVPLLTAFASRYSPRASEIHLDATVLAFALALAALVAVLLSMVAFMPSDNMLASVSAGGRRAGGTIRRQRLQRGLVVVQVAVSVMLLAGAGLLTRTTLRIAEAPTGLQTENVLTMSVNLRVSGVLGPDADVLARQQYDRIRDELAAQPGVRLVGVGSIMPLRTMGMLVSLAAEGRAPEPGAPVLRADLRMAGPEYFAAAGIPIQRGRPFLPTDRSGAPKVVIINQLLAQQLFPGEDPVGRRLELLDAQSSAISTDWRTVVGVAGNTQDGGPEAQPMPAIFMPFAQEALISGGFVVRGDSTIGAIAPQVTRLVRRLAPTTPIENVMTIAQYRDLSVAPRRLNAELVSSFGLLAMILSAVGIAGVFAFSVSARMAEIGVRMSLGARPGQVQQMVLAEGGVLVGLGLLLGVAAAYGATGLLRGLLFDVSPRDPQTFAATVLAMAVIGLAACWGPAARAARIDPAITLREG
jgi:putative ABC transport system permease protein